MWLLPESSTIKSKASSWVSVIAGVCTLLLTIFHTVKELVPPVKSILGVLVFPRTIYIVEILVLVVFLIALHEKTSTPRPGDQNKAASDQVIDHFIVLAGLWAAQYGWLLFIDFRGSGSIPYAVFIRNTFNILPIIPILGAYACLREYTVGGHVRFVLRHPWLVPLVGAILFLLLELLVGSADTKDSDASSIVFSAASGIALGIALALLIGRLDSLWLEINPIVIALLYLLSVIQIAWIYINSKPAVSAPDALIYWLLAIALFAKIILFVTVVWMIETRKLMFFIQGMRDQLEHYNDRFEKFLQRYTRAERAD